MSVCLSHTNDYPLTCCSSNHQIPSEVDAATVTAVSDTCLLLVNDSVNRLVLYDLSSLPLKSQDIDWPSDTYGTVRDMCWAKHIDSFLILSEEVLCSYSPDSNQLVVQLASSSSSSSSNERFWSLAVLDCDAYVLYRSDSLDQYCLPSWKLTRSWSRAELIAKHDQDQYIGQIRAHPCAGVIALLIRLKRHRRWRVDLLDRNMRKLHAGEPIRMASAYPNLALEPFGQHGQWTLRSEKYIWLIQSDGHFLERRSRQGKQDSVE